MDCEEIAQRDLKWRYEKIWKFELSISYDASDPTHYTQYIAGANVLQKPTGTEWISLIFKFSEA